MRTRAPQTHGHTLDTIDTHTRFAYGGYVLQGERGERGERLVEGDEHLVPERRQLGHALVAHRVLDAGALLHVGGAARDVWRDDDLVDCVQDTQQLRGRGCEWQ